MEVVPGTSCESVHQKAQSKIKDIDIKIAELYRIKNALERFKQHCSLDKGIGECEFLHLLEE